MKLGVPALPGPLCKDACFTGRSLVVYRNGFLPGSLGRGGGAGGQAAEAQEAAPGPFCRARLLPSPAPPPLAGLVLSVPFAVEAASRADLPRGWAERGTVQSSSCLL